MRERKFTIIRILQATLYVLIISIILPLFAYAEAGTGNTTGNMAPRRPRTVVDIRVVPLDTDAIRAIATIEARQQDGRWLLASASGTLLDSMRGRGDSVAHLNEFIASQFRSTGIDPSDTLVSVLARRIDRDSEIRALLKRRIVKRRSDGFMEILPTRMPRQAGIRQRIEELVSDENTDRMKMMSLVEESLESIR